MIWCLIRKATAQETQSGTCLFPMINCFTLKRKGKTKMVGLTKLTVARWSSWYICKDTNETLQQLFVSDKNAISTMVKYILKHVFISAVLQTHSVARFRNNAKWKITDFIKFRFCLEITAVYCLVSPFCGSGQYMQWRVFFQWFPVCFSFHSQFRDISTSWDQLPKTTSPVGDSIRDMKVDFSQYYSR